MCRIAFLGDLGSDTARRDVAIAAPGAILPTAPLVIDEGLRRWHESCSCYLSDAYPEVKAPLDAERIAHEHEPAGAGICVVAEAG